MRLKQCICMIAAGLICLSFTASAESVSLFGGGTTFMQKREPLIQRAPRPTLLAAAPSLPVAQTAPLPQVSISAPSLFAGQVEGSMFAPYPARTVAARVPTPLQPNASGLERLRHIIQQAESRRMGYDAVQHGARIKPSKLPTQMTVGEIYAWIDATPGQPHAIGRYQFIPSTLRRLVRHLGVRPEQVFSPTLQDQLADVLLADAGIHQVRAGDINRHTFMNNLAKIWAGLPNSTGRSHYDGYAGNKASISWANFDAQMAVIFPMRSDFDG